MRKYGLPALLLVLLAVVYARTDSFKTTVKTVRSLIAGTSITLSDDGAGNITINSSASGGGGGLPLPNGASNYIQHYDTATVYNLQLTTWNVAGINTPIITFGDGTTQVTAPPPAGTGVESSSFSFCLCGSGTAFPSTSPFKIDGGSWVNLKSTFNITAAQAVTTIPSSFTVVFGVGRSTEVLDTNINFPAIHSTSFPITAVTPPVKYGAIILPNNITRILPGEQLSVFLATMPVSTNMPGGTWGVMIHGWFEAGKGY